MTVYAVCLGMTLAVAAGSIEEAIEKARAELQSELDEGTASQQKVAWNFDTYDVCEVRLKDEVITFK